MRVFFDTTVLVASMIEDQSGHDAALQALDRCAKDDRGYAALHSVAECFATLTGGRLAVQVSPADAAEMIRTNVAEALELVALTKTEYVNLIASAQSIGVRGGGIYDSLLLECARKSKAERILTFNTRHFAAFAPDLRALIHAP